MNFEESRLASSMLALHEAELEQAARYRYSSLSDRIERRVVLQRRRNQPLRRLGSLLERIGQQLQQSAAPKTMPSRRSVSPCD